MIPYAESAAFDRERMGPTAHSRFSTVVPCSIERQAMIGETGNRIGVKTMKYLEALTEEHKAAMAPYAKEWIDKALDCTPVNRAEVEDGIRRCYELSELPWHGKVIWVDNPLEVAIEAPLRCLAIDELTDRQVELTDENINAEVESLRGTDRAKEASKQHVPSQFGGQHWCLSWAAWRLFFRDVVGLELPGDTWDRAQAYADANMAGRWWPHSAFVVISERPLYIHLERVRPDGWGSHQLHNATGASVAWRGWELYHWHGTRVPAWVVGGDGGPTAAKIFAEENMEVRRCAIEAMGWDNFIKEAQLVKVDSCPDPANSPFEVELYDVPQELLDLDTEEGDGIRVVLLVNGTTERDGTRRRYGQMVPKSCNTAIEAAAWLYDVPVAEYKQLMRRT